jgi:hypothetical protein
LSHTVNQGLYATHICECVSSLCIHSVTAGPHQCSSVKAPRESTLSFKLNCQWLYTDGFTPFRVLEPCRLWGRRNPFVRAMAVRSHPSRVRHVRFPSPCSSRAPALENAAPQGAARLRPVVAAWSNRCTDSKARTAWQVVLCGEILHPDSKLVILPFVRLCDLQIEAWHKPIS